MLLLVTAHGWDETKKKVKKLPVISTAEYSCMGNVWENITPATRTGHNTKKNREIPI
jgi:hypothetical protein